MGFLLATCLLISCTLSATSHLSPCCRGKHFLLFILNVAPHTFPLLREAAHTQFPPILFILVMVFKIPSSIFFSRLTIYQVSPHTETIYYLLSSLLPLPKPFSTWFFLLGGIRTAHLWWTDYRLVLWQVDIQ